MDNFRKLKRQVQQYTFLLGALTVIVLIGISWFVRHLFPAQNTLISIGLLVVGLGAVWAVSHFLTEYALQPLDVVWRAILHVTPGHPDTAPPNLEKNKIGQELVTTLALQVYELASSSQQTKTTQEVPKPEVSIVSQIGDNLPLPVFAVNKDGAIIFANEACLKYLGLPKTEVLQKNLYSVFDLAFSDEDTLDGWLKDCRANRATDQHAWQRVRLKLADQKTIRQFDLAGAYSKENPTGVEMLLALFDETERYQTDDQALDFIALTVHELRTPLTALRGFIEMFQDEIAPQLDPEMTEFMHKMQVSAQQLTAFVTNILNVARIQEGQLTLQLHEEHWDDVIRSCVETMAMQARLRGMTITATIDPKIPTVAVDKTSISEVINNLIDNAIKYSGTSKTITINAAMTSDGLVETTVHDDGVGIPGAVMPTLFEKFHRNHRNMARIGGTGLGLYLCSSLIKAQGGNIWLKSKEGKGTTVGFTIQPYSLLAGKLKASNNTDIVRNAHGWIKNHSLYRR